MNSVKRAALIIGGIALAVFLYAAFGWEAEYQDYDTSDIVPEELFAESIGLLEESESWPVQLSDGNVEVKSSTDHYPVRTVRYEIKELDTTMEEAIAYVRDHSYGGLERRVADDKYEDTLWQPEDTVGHPTRWVRRQAGRQPARVNCREFPRVRRIDRMVRTRPCRLRAAGSVPNVQARHVRRQSAGHHLESAYWSLRNADQEETLERRKHRGSVPGHNAR